MSPTSVRPHMISASCVLSVVSLPYSEARLGFTPFGIGFCWRVKFVFTPDRHAGSVHRWWSANQSVIVFYAGTGENGVPDSPITLRRWRADAQYHGGCVFAQMCFVDNQQIVLSGNTRRIRCRRWQSVDFPVYGIVVGVIRPDIADFIPVAHTPRTD